MGKRTIFYKALRETYNKQDAKELSKLMVERLKLVKSNAKPEEIEVINARIYEITDK